MAERKVPVSFFEGLEDARKSLREESLLALEHQLAMVEYLRSERSQEATEAFVRTYGHSKLRDHRSHLSDQTQAKWLRSRQEEVLKDAPTYFVSKDMTEMIRQAAEEMPREGLSPVDLLTGSGFLYFHHSIPIVGPAGHPDSTDPANAGLMEGNFGTVEGEEIIGIRAIAWTHDEYVARPDGTRGPGISYHLYMEGDEAYAYSQAHRDPDMAAITLHEFKNHFGQLVHYDFSGWSYGLDWDVVPYDQPPEPLATPVKVHPVVDQVRKLLLGTWRMLSQKIVMLETQRPPRAMRRRAGRIIPGDGDVTVIRLRREYHPEGGEDQAALNAQAGDEPWYNHRFLVRGHWKRQFHGPGRTERKLIWVAPYIKGPKDAPLVLKSRIYSLEQ